MPRIFIVTEYGIPRVAEELKPYSPNRLAAMKASWSQCKAFDGTSRFEPKLKQELSFSTVQRLLAHTIYNPSAGVRVEWAITGVCTLAEIVAEVEKGLGEDDDIIQQWFGAGVVLTLLRSATTFDEMVDRVRCICGEFETDDRLRRIVDHVLGTTDA